MANFFSPSYHEIDPYKYWNKHFGGDYGVAKNALQKAMWDATNRPDKSPAFQLGKDILDRDFRANRQKMISALTQRGTAFSGQARRASADIGEMKARALMELIRKIQGMGPEYASRLGSMIPGVAAPQVAQEESGFDKYIKYMSAMSQAIAAASGG